MEKNKFLVVFLPPNILTLLRLFTGPFLIYLISIENWEKSAILGSIIVATDFADGFLARRFNMVTNFGKIMDPVADKIILISLTIIFLWKEILPNWICFILLGKDVSIPILIIFARFKGIKFSELSPTILGKLSAGGQFMLSILVILDKSFMRVDYFPLLPIISLLAILAFVSYFFKIRKLIN